ncbi:NAD-dependent epimerase/dehydratase family protein [Actinopolymorpha alba]|uniref:NAD-dependent epimerase/dehydratase family protein n=1 Tax=Actinopolymorpha alba TaxID=533267 RepID=UPI00038125C5|nr:NAD(P)-dependent oxidoreductase [Actinopolymorpha alba]
MKILMTGAAGYIGTWLGPELREHGHEVYGADLRPQETEHHTVTDLLDPDSVERLFAEVRPDVVVHLAAKYGRVQGEDRRWETVRDNAEMTTLIAEACGAFEARLVYVSSSEVYGTGLSGADWTKPRAWNDVKPLNLYGLTKLWGEQVAELYAPTGLVIARLNMPYGPGPSSGTPAHVGRNALHTFLWQAHHRHPITVHQDTSRSYTWVGDVMAGLRMAIEQSQDGGRYVVSRTDDLRTSEEVAKLACEIADWADPVINIVGRPKGVTPVKTYDNSTTLALGWKPTVELELGIQRTYDWIRHFDEDGLWQV